MTDELTAAELAYREQHTDAERAYQQRKNLTASPNPAGAVWIRDTNGREWHVDVGSPLHRALLTRGAEVIDAPEGDG